MSNTTTFGSVMSHQLRNFAAASALALVAALPATTAPASAGLLDLLFGRRQAPVAQPAPMPIYIPQPAQSQRPVATVRKAQPKAKVARAAVGKAERGEKVARAGRGEKAHEVLPGPLGHFLADPTLRRGDVVVTSEGLKIFVGTLRGGQHGSGDFVALSEATQFKAGGSPVLAEIDKANILASPALVEEAGEVLPKPVIKVEEKPAKGKRAALGDGKTRVQ